MFVIGTGFTANVYFQYWPSRGTETYGVMCVTLTDTQELATYVIRTLQLQRVSSAHVRHPVMHSTQYTVPGRLTALPRSA